MAPAEYWALTMDEFWLLYEARVLATERFGTLTNDEVEDLAATLKSAPATLCRKS